ncbi:MAG: T9SS type A sorting domain-containing protein [Sphingobacteriales bacterium]|nr:T9SS type A sorting domain-containing protein [Sphingobacteriales bacterium]
MVLAVRHCLYFTGLEDAHPQVLQLSISPNPANNQVQIGLPATANHQNATLQITDLQGRVVKTITYTTASFGGGKGEASTHDLPNGMYLVSYTQQGLLLGRAKMVVQH